MRKNICALLLAFGLAPLVATSAFAGWFDPFVSPEGPYSTEQLCKEEKAGCRGVMIYDQGEAPDERNPQNYFYTNPNRDWTKPPLKHNAYR